METWTWDPSLQWSLDYFNMVANTSTLDRISPSYFNIMVHNYPWDHGIQLCSLIIGVEDDTFIRGMECSVTRGIIWGTKGGTQWD
jgi:hypothetical protein